jgi:hypothetical protein
VGEGSTRSRRSEWGIVSWGGGQGGGGAEQGTCTGTSAVDTRERPAPKQSVGVGNDAIEAVGYRMCRRSDRRAMQGLQQRCTELSLLGKGRRWGQANRCREYRWRRSARGRTVRGVMMYSSGCGHKWATRTHVQVHSAVGGTRVHAWGGAVCTGGGGAGLCVPVGGGAWHT